MPSRNITTSSSTIRTDYGSTTFKISIDNDDSVVDNESEASVSAGASSGSTTSTITTATAIGYQSLPYMSTTNLFAKSTTSRFDKMSIDTMPNSEMRQINQRIEYFFNVLNQICIGFVTIYMSWLCLRMGLSGTALHAWLVTVGVSTKQEINGRRE